MKIGGEWHYLYRARDRDGNVVDSMLSKTRAMDAAKRFFRGAQEVAGCKPARVTTVGSIDRLRYGHAVATPYKKRASHYLALVTLAAIMIWLN